MFVYSNVRECCTHSDSHCMKTHFYLFSCMFCIITTQIFVCLLEEKVYILLLLYRDESGSYPSCNDPTELLTACLAPHECCFASVFVK